jgi:hypothetical protein
MQLRILSIIGEALNFGGRRMETIARVSWLPVVLLLIVNMVTVFAFLTVIAGRVITFHDVGTFTTAKRLLARYLEQAWQSSPVEMMAITGVSLTLQALLTASFMAPLIRYSGLGEKPHAGVIRMPFGADQIRYILAGVFSVVFVVLLILAPMAGATYYVLKYIFDALSKTLASFPDPNSLHTIEFVSTGDQLAANGAAWYLNLGIPLLAVVPFALVLWLIVYSHFHPRNRPNAPEDGRPVLRAIVTLGVAGAAVGAAYLVMRADILAAFKSAGGLHETLGNIVTNTPANAHLLIGAVIVVLLGYLNLRLYPYPGVAVCRKSMGFGNTFRVSRGWNIIRLQALLIIIGSLLFLTQYFINSFALAWILETLKLLYSAVATSTRLVNSGVTADWVTPLFVWIWNGIKILVNIFWTFFSYGVIAGLYGRLYRESEREETDVPPKPFEKAIWRRN